MDEAKPAARRSSSDEFASFFRLKPVSNDDHSSPTTKVDEEKENNPDQLKNFQNWLRNTLVLAVDQSTRIGYEKLLNVNLNCLYYYYGFLDIALLESLETTNQQSAKDLVKKLIAHHKLTREKGVELMAAELIKSDASQQFDCDSAISFINDKINELFASVEQQNVKNKNVNIFLEHYKRFLNKFLENLNNVYKLSEEKNPLKMAGGYLGIIFSSGVLNNNLFDVAYQVNSNQTLEVKNVMQNLLITAAKELELDAEGMPEIVFYNLGIVI